VEVLESQKFAAENRRLGKNEGGARGFAKCRQAKYGEICEMAGVLRERLKKEGGRTNRIQTEKGIRARLKKIQFRGKVRYNAGFMKVGKAVRWS